MLDTRLPIRSSLNQFYINPFQRGCETAATAAPGCGTITLFNNGFNAAAGTSRETAEQARLGRNDRRTIVGGRWEHDFDNQTTWRNQFVFDDRNINQPTGTTSAIGDYPSYNFMSDLVRRSELLGMDSTSYLGAFYNTLSWSVTHTIWRPEEMRRAADCSRTSPASTPTMVSEPAKNCGSPTHGPLLLGSGGRQPI